MKFENMIPFPNGHSKAIEEVIIRVDRNNPKSNIKCIVEGFDEVGIMKLRDMLLKEVKRQNDGEL